MQVAVYLPGGVAPLAVPRSEIYIGSHAPAPCFSGESMRLSDVLDSCTAIWNKFGQGNNGDPPHLPPFYQEKMSIFDQNANSLLAICGCYRPSAPSL